MSTSVFRFLRVEHGFVGSNASEECDFSFRSTFFGLIDRDTNFKRDGSNISFQGNLRSVLSVR